MQVLKPQTSTLRHKDLLLYIMSESGPATSDTIYMRTLRLISTIRNRTYPLNYLQFQKQLQSLLRKGLIVRNGYALQVTERGYLSSLLV